MRLRDFIDTTVEYKAAEEEIRTWVEKSYPGLTIEFNYPAPEVVQTDPSVRFTKRRVRKIIEAVNLKIDEALESRAERIYIAERLDRIYKNHPEFDLEVNDIEFIKRHPLFLTYLDELIIRSD